MILKHHSWEPEVEVILSVIVGPYRVLANVNSFAIYAIARPSVVCLSYVVCNFRAPYSLLRRFKFSAIFLRIRYLGHPLTSTDNFTEMVPGHNLSAGELNTRGVAKYSHFGPIDGYISETVQDRRSISINH